MYFSVIGWFQADAASFSVVGEAFNGE